MPKLKALEDTLLCVRPIQSSVLLAEEKPNQVYKIEGGTVLECDRLDWFEGERKAAELDGDDYWHPMLSLPLAGCPVLNWFAYAKHWQAEEDKHPEMTDQPDVAVLSEDDKKTAANLVKSASTAALEDKDSTTIVKDLGALIQIPGKAFARGRRVHEPIFWQDDKPAPFTWGEMTKGGTRVPETEAIAFNIVKIAKVLTYFRELLAQPIEVTSGYRDPYSNRMVGGARYSRHMSGDAADIKPMRDGITQDTWQIMCDHFLGGGLAISGYDGEPEYGFFHLDARGGGDPLSDHAGKTYWGYPNMPSWADAVIASSRRGLY